MCNTNFGISILYPNPNCPCMTIIPMIDDSSPKELRCTTCLLPIQYQTKKDGKFLWQCFKCGKQYLISENLCDGIEERWSPPR